MLPRRVWLLILTPVLLLVIGTLGYEWLEPEYTIFDSFYMTVITLTTVGFGEISPGLSPAGRVLTLFLLLGGAFAFFWAAGEIIRTIVSGEMQKALGRRRMERSLASITDHMIVCGYGRMGQIICREFSMHDLPFVLIDSDEQQLQGFQLPHGIPLVGDATADEILRKAGIMRARALVTVAGSDADNLFITMSARLLSDKVHIVARAENEQAQEKLRRAGANRVITPYILGGKSVAQAVLRPAVVEFIDLATGSDHHALQMAEVNLPATSAFVDMPIMVFDPPGDAILRAADTLIVLGHREQLANLARLAKGK